MAVLAKLADPDDELTASAAPGTDWRALRSPGLPNHLPYL
jgi:hypothetical protein